MNCLHALAVALLVLSVGSTSHAQPPAKKRVEAHGAKKTDKDVSAIAIGDKVPSFSIVTLAGKTESLAELQKDSKSGRTCPVVLTFWCSFCGSCRKIDKSLDEFAAEFKDQATVVAIDASAPDSAKAIAEFVKEHKLSVPVVIDEKGKVADLFGTHVTTTTVVIDAAGKLRYRGQFAHGTHSYAKDALKAILDGKVVAHKETKEHG